MKRLDNEKSRTIDYAAGTAVLEDYYERQFELVKKGNTDLVTLELMMLGRALDFMQFANKRLGVALDTSEASVDLFEEVLDALNRGIVQDDLFSDESGSIAKSLCAYLGLLILANIGGKWEHTENGYAINVNGREAYVNDYIERRLIGLSAEPLPEYYRSVKIVKT